MNENFEVILDEDDEEYARTLVELAPNFNINISHFAIWNQAKEELISNFHKYHALIIDGQGRIDQDKQEAEDAHLFKVIRDLEDLKNKGKYIPFVVNTGLKANFDKYFKFESTGFEVFDKTNDEELLRAILRIIKDGPKAQLRLAYPTVFSFAERYFDEKNRELLYELVLKIGSNEKPTTLNSFAEKKAILDSLRYLNEALVDTLRLDYESSPFSVKEYAAKVERENPPRPRKDGKKPKLGPGNRSVWMIDYFFRTNDIPREQSYIQNTVKNIYYTASTNFSHSNNQTYIPSAEMIRGLVYCHLGCYEWFNEIIQD